MNFNHIAKSHYGISAQNAQSIPTITVFFINFALTISFWFELAKSRNTLSELTDDQLQDIGKTRHEANLEANRKYYEI